jgi:hypothetical protein
VLEQLATQLGQLCRVVQPLAREAQRVRLKQLDPWDSSQRTREEQAEFKEKLITTYACGAPDVDGIQWARCMATDTVLPRALVRASHIWKHSTGGEYLTEFGLSRKDVHNPRNGLMLAEAVEDAFDHKGVAFWYDGVHDTFTLRILNPNLLQLPIANLAHLKQVPTGLFVPNLGTFDGRVLRLPEGVRPFRRLLAWHFLVSVMNARREGWALPGDIIREHASQQGATLEQLHTRSPSFTSWPSDELMSIYDMAAARSVREERSDSDAE